jgi:RimJ/RimL family protein N-acetyltransferase
MPFPERVETERLTLRRWLPEDRAAFEWIWRDPEVAAALRPGLDFDARFVQARFDHHLRHWAEHGFGIWAVEERGVVAGWAGASHPDFVPELAASVEIGWTLQPPFRGRGLATEAARAAAAAAFAHLDLDRVISLIHPPNERSIAVARRLGMRPAEAVRHAHAGVELRVFALERVTTTGRGRVPRGAGSSGRRRGG